MRPICRYSITKKTKRIPGKAGLRFWKNVGLGFKTPKEAIEGEFSLPPQAKRRGQAKGRVCLLGGPLAEQVNRYKDVPSSGQEVCRAQREKASVSPLRLLHPSDQLSSQEPQLDPPGLSSRRAWYSSWSERCSSMGRGREVEEGACRMN